MDVFYDYQIFSLQQFGGISRYFSEITWRINQFDDCSATVFCPLSINHYLEKNNNGRGLNIPRIPKSGKMIRFCNEYISRIHTHLHQYDVLHKTYYYDSRLSGKKTVITVYDMISELYPHFFPYDNRIRNYRVKAIRNSDAVICISHNTKADLLKFIDIDPEKIFVTYLGYSSLPIMCNNEELNTPAEPFLLYVGKRGGHKNFKQMIKGFAASKTLKSDFQIVCFGDKPITKAEVDLITNNGLDPDRIHHISGDDRQLAGAYRKAAAFVYPSLYEGFGIPVLEAMSCECPVICSNSSSLPEVAGQAAEMFDPHDTESICHSLESVLYSEQRSSVLIKRGKERCNAFSWDRCASETRAVYHSI